ncbi:pectinesterase-like [Impatiens glandulifera]|uniref:pectinesterase-like n=1 Tax=Impatiens glandulifera TaxID=253017 RepID=UPI001FB18DE9|nr:pectinesterase-like [Impatiens glandulifera]
MVNLNITTLVILALLIFTTISTTTNVSANAPAAAPAPANAPAAATATAPVHATATAPTPAAATANAPVAATANSLTTANAPAPAAAISLTTANAPAPAAAISLTTANAPAPAAAISLTTANAPAPAAANAPAAAPANSLTTANAPAPAAATANAPANAPAPTTANSLQLNMCSTTDYKNTCLKSLSATGGTKNPTLVIWTAFSTAINGTQMAIDAISTLLQSNSMVDYEICLELLDLAKDDINKAIKKYEEVTSTGKNKDKLFSDIKTSLSGSLTFHQTCIDEIENMTTNGDNMQVLKVSRELSSNALAMLTFQEDNVPTSSSSSSSSSSSISKVNNMLVMAPAPSPAAAAYKDDQVWLFIVSKDGSGMFSTINEALSAISIKIDNHIERKRFVIYVKSGIYQEYVEITKKMNNILLIGDGPTKTRIVGNKSVKGGFKTFKTPTLVVNGENFIARDISIENTAGGGNYEAVALRIAADKSIIYNSYIDGYQNTLYAHAHRQFYRDCTISGTMDFIFGNAAAMFQNCKIVVKRPRTNQKSCVITAQGRTDSRCNTGFIFQNCTITADESYSAIKQNLTSFLGRPWKRYSRTMFMESEIEDVIDPKGWMTWIGREENWWTVWYGEYLNRGTGAEHSKRVNWVGFHKNITDEVAGDFVPRRFIDGDDWIPVMGIPYFPNFTSTVSSH